MKISLRYLKRLWSYCWFCSNWYHTYGHPMSTQCTKWTYDGHRYAVNLNKINDNSKTVQDILMKFSPDVNHNSVVNWWKNFGRSTTDMFATPLFVSKLREGLAPTLFEIFSKKIFWWGSRPISVTKWQEFQISPKKWRFEIFGTSAPSRGNRVIHDQTYKMCQFKIEISINQVNFHVKV